MRPQIRLIIIRAVACAVGLWGLTPCPAAAQTGVNTADDPLTGAPRTDLYRLKKRFDFDERPRGNFEDVPMHWHKLTGAGLPFFDAGHFDDQVGHDTAPSFMLNIQTGNVAYEYDYIDLTVIPHSDYFLVGHIRTRGLEHARAFIAAYLVDRFNERIPGSERISDLVRDSDTRGDGWQRVEIALPGEFPDAFAMRVQLWILHVDSWRRPNETGIDPIVRRDVDGTAWFDDIAIFRLPRARMSLSNPAGLVEPGASEALLVDVTNATPQPLTGKIEISDADGGAVYDDRITIPGISSPGEPGPATTIAGSDSDGATVRLASGIDADASSIRMPLPQLAAGLYTARLRLSAGKQLLLTRHMRFAVLPELDTPPARLSDFGAEIGRWRRGDVRGASELLHALGVGATKIGVPMIGALDSAEKTAYFNQIAELVRTLSEERIETTGVILTQTAGLETRGGQSTLAMLADNAWQSLCNPIFAHFGGLIVSWQLGSEQIETRSAGQWKSSIIDRFRDHLRRFVTFPDLAIPQSITALSDVGDDVASVEIDPTIPARHLAEMLGFLVTNPEQATWLRIAPAEQRGLGRHTRVADLAQRIVIAKALSPQRIYVPPPFELRGDSGQSTWQPTDEFIPLRTLFWYLSGKTAVAAPSPAPGVQAIMFEGVQTNCMVIWSWNEPAEGESIEMYLGPNVHAIDLNGADIPLETNDGRTRVPVGQTPIIIEQLRTAVALLQSSFRLSPTFVEIHNPHPLPTISFKNTFDTRLVGELEITAPQDWSFAATRWAFLLEPGETFERKLEPVLPPRLLAQEYPLDVTLMLSSPQSETLRFQPRLTIGLRDIQMSATPIWDGDDLIIEQTLRNLSDETVSFSAFCEPPGRGRSVGQFIDVGPGQIARQTYVFAAARGPRAPAFRSLGGSQLHCGVSEIRGGRSLDQVVEVPQ